MVELNLIRSVFSGEYDIIDILGKGGMATVFKATHISLNRVVALKVIPKEYSENTEFKTRFEREAIDSAQLTHPNIITIYDHGERKGYQFISMAHLPNGSLSDKIRQKGHLSEIESIDILIPILEGIAFAHSNGTIHRDIKSSNIMFDANNNPVLMDFGISKSKDSIKLTVSGTFIGTLEYASPEQIESSDIVDNRSDIYSLGILAYEMVTGTVPFKGSMTSVINQVVNTPPPYIKNINADISAEFANVITKAIQKNPDDRFQNANEFINSLKSIKEQKKNQQVVNIPNKNYKKENSKNRIPKKTRVKETKNTKKTGLLIGILSILLIVLITGTVFFYLKYVSPSPDISAQSSTKHPMSTVPKVNQLKQPLSFSDLYSVYGINMVKVRGGKYLMGSDNGKDDESPSHPVKVNTFYISSTEITQNTWKKIENNLPPGNHNCPNCPVVNVSWNDAINFIQKLNKKTKRFFSLPYECEWEYAAKEGEYGLNVKYIPVYSGDVNPDKVGWYNSNSYGALHRVAELKKNKLGLYDMSGNVWEWCYDYYNPNYYRSAKQKCSGPDNGSYKVIRGGSFFDNMLQMRNTNREKAPPGTRRKNIGFRIVVR